MSNPHTTSAPQDERFDASRHGLWKTISILLAVVGLVGSAIGLFGGDKLRDQFAYSWLFAFAYFFTLCAGSLFWVLLHHAVDANWSVVVRRVLETMASLSMVMAVAFIPVAICAKILYKWMTTAHTDHLLHEKAGWLNQPFFWGRVIFYFLFFIGVSLWLRKLSTAQDEDGKAEHTLKMRKISVISIPLFALCLTFGSVDWLMGLDWHWFSTMWGVYIFAGSAFSSMALLILIVTMLRRAGYLQNVVTLEHYHIMGKLLFAFCVFWAYIAFSQYFLIWYANIPEETMWFIERNKNSWYVFSVFFVIGHFFIPFVVLIHQPIKRRPCSLSAMCVWILFMHAVDMYWIVLPAKHHHGFNPHWLDFATWLGIAGLLSFVFLMTLGRSSIYPKRDPRLTESLHLVN